MRIYRLDNFNENKLEWQKLANGSYRAFITLGVADLPLEYEDVKGNTFTESIELNELIRDDSLKSAYGMPVLLGHPESGIYENNKEKLLIGHTLESFVRNGDILLMPVVIDDKRGVRLIDKAIDEGYNVECSPGYWLTDKQLVNDSHYHQIGRIYDHIAIGGKDWGRGGQKIVLRTDSKNIHMAGKRYKYLINDNIDTIPNVSTVPTNQPQKTMVDPDGDGDVDFPAPYTLQQSKQEPIITSNYSKCIDWFDYGDLIEQREMTSMSNVTVTFLNKVYEIPSEIAAEMDSRENKIKQIKTQLDSKTSEIAQLKGQLAIQNKRVDDMESSLMSPDGQTKTMTEDEATEMMKECMELWGSCLPAFQQQNPEFTPDYSLKPTEIKQLYLSTFHPDVQIATDDPADASDPGNNNGTEDQPKLDSRIQKAFIDGAWNAIKTSLGKPQQQKTRQDRVAAQLDQLKSLAPVNDSSIINSLDDTLEQGRLESLKRITSRHN